MEFGNKKIRKLIEERDATIQKYNIEIKKEIENEKAKYKFSWKRFLFIISLVILMVLAVETNKKIFSKTSIWSWAYYLK